MTINTENPNEVSAYILTGYATEYEVFGTLHMPSPWNTYDEGGYLHVEFMDDAIIEDIHYFDDLFGHQVNLNPGDDLYKQALANLVEAHEDEVRDNFEYIHQPHGEYL